MKKAIAALAATVAHRGESTVLEQAHRTGTGATAPRHTEKAEVETKAETPKVDPLSKDEKAEFKHLESVIEKGLKVFVEVGNALTKIRDARLYRETHPTFEAYCRERWGISKTHANRLIQGATVAANLAPIGVTLQNEAQVRVLASLPPAKQAQVVKQALKAADGNANVITARALEETAQKLGIKPSNPAQVASTAGNVSGGRGATTDVPRGDVHKLVNRDEVISAIREWANENWEKASTLSVAEFVNQIKTVIKGL